MRLRKKPEIVEITTFEEFVAYGLENGENVVGGVPWSFKFHGYTVTHETDQCYLIGLDGGRMDKFTPEYYLLFTGERLLMFRADTIKDHYERVDDMPFREALALLKFGHALRRKSWKPGVFIFRQVPSNIPATVIPNMTSLPSCVKVEIARRGTGLQYDNQIAMVDPDSNVCGWVPSPADLFAEDWENYPTPEELS